MKLSKQTGNGLQITPMYFGAKLGKKTQNTLQLHYTMCPEKRNHIFDDKLN